MIYLAEVLKGRFLIIMDEEKKDVETITREFLEELDKNKVKPIRIAKNDPINFMSWKEITEALIDKYLTLVDLCIRQQKDFEYSFVGYSDEALANMLEHRAKFDFNKEETIIEIKKLAKTHKYSVIYDNISLFIYFAQTHGEAVGNLYMLEPHMSAEKLGLLYEQRKDQEQKLLEHIEDFKEFVTTVWNPSNGIIFKMRINEILKTIRIEAGLSQVQLAELVDATQGTISNLEKSMLANPTFDILKGYITKVGANPMFLFGLDPTAPPILLPAIQVERMKGEKRSKVKEKIIKDLEDSISRLKSL